jgi:hypothetical protein
MKRRIRPLYGEALTTRERGVRDRSRLDDGGRRFKDRTVQVAFGVLGLLLLVFDAGIAATYYYSDNPYMFRGW